MDPDQGLGSLCSILNSSIMLGNYLQQTTSADDILRCIFFLALKGLKDKTSIYKGLYSPTLNKICLKYSQLKVNFCIVKNLKF